MNRNMLAALLCLFGVVLCLWSGTEILITVAAPVLCVQGMIFAIFAAVDGYGG